MPARTINPALRLLMAVTALAAWVGLLLQLYIFIVQALANGTSLTGVIVNYFSFFTILTNMLLALSLTLASWKSDITVGRFFRRDVIRTGIAVYIAIVGLGYSVLLRHLWSPEGLQKVADILLHDIVPLMYVTYWLIAPKIALPWNSILRWLIYPVVYLFYVFARGEMLGRYQYPFLDIAQLGYARVLTSTAALLGVFVFLGLLLVCISRWIGHTGPANAEETNSATVRGPDQPIRHEVHSGCRRADSFLRSSLCFPQIPK